MKSPFPGMDPYLERSWLDVHQSLCIYARDLLQPQVRPNLLVRASERLVVESDAYDRRSIHPDVFVVEHRFDPSTPPRESAIGVAEPLLISAPNDPLHEGFLQILDPSAGGKIVTVIEFLSISNKTSLAGTALYLKKQDEVVDAGVTLVEIDLLRAGEWVMRAPEYMVPSDARPPYRVCV